MIKRGLKKFMNLSKPLSRWMVLIIFLTGMFCGAVVGLIFFLSALVG